MILCNICKDEFINNKDGSLTKHLLEKHNISFEDYYIKYNLNNIEPKCTCGFCNERPRFYRGNFKQFATGHNTANYFQQKYIEKYGIPRCLLCGKISGFKKGRKKPLNFCSSICHGLFFKEQIIEKMRPKIIEKWKNKKYRNFHIKRIKNHCNQPEQKKKTSLFFKEKWKNIDFRNKMSLITKNNWKNTKTREKRIKGIIKSLNTNKIKKLRSKQAKKRWNSDKYFNLIDNIKRKFSKLHLKVIQQLNLRELGFTGEQRINRYLVDEINFKNKIIIEINGDYIHANPKIYNRDFIIKLPRCSYSAFEKWKKDRKKINFLKKQGYKVFVIWESDDLSCIKRKLNKLLNKNE